MLEQERLWVSFRGQTLARTGEVTKFCILFCSLSVLANDGGSEDDFYLLVRGMMYYRQALELQYFLEFAGESGKFLSSPIS